MANLPEEYFGEGITLFKNQIFQLTWQSGVAFTYDLLDFCPSRQFSYKGEGWGLTTDGRELFMSDGSDVIRVLDPSTFAEKRHLKVHNGSTRIQELNELEFVDGQIFANIWHSNRIARISPQTGAVVGWIDLQGLLSPVYRLDSEGVLNGIAYDAKNKRLFVTGKLWPRIFQIKVVAKQRSPLVSYPDASKNDRHLTTFAGQHQSKRAGSTPKFSFRHTHRGGLSCVLSVFSLSSHP